MIAFNPLLIFVTLCNISSLQNTLYGCVPGVQNAVEAGSYFLYHISITSFVLAAD